jgi:Outer membrane protein beta-barrel domain
MRLSFSGGILVLALLGGAGAAQAQETFTPIFKAPYRPFNQHEIGVSFSDPGENVDFALEGSYTYGKDANDFGVRGGFAEFGDRTRVLVGGDFRTRVLNYSESFPFDGALTLGVGGTFGAGDDVFAIPVGVSLGRHFEVEGSSTTFTPYIHPNIVPEFGGDDDGVKFTFGLGVDIRFSDRWAVRASGGLGDIEGVGITVAYIR